MKKIYIFFLISILVFIISSNKNSNENIYSQAYEKTIDNYKLNTIYDKSTAIETLQLSLDKLMEYHPLLETEVINEVNTQFQIEKLNLNEQVTMQEIIMSISRIYAKINDFHTRVILNLADIYLLPYKFDYYKWNLYFNEGEYIVQSIDGIYIDTLFNKFKNIWSYELEEWVFVSFEKYIRNREYLELLGIDISKDIEMKYIDSDGIEHIEHLLNFEKNIQNSVDVQKYDYEIHAEENYAIFTLENFPSEEESEPYKKSLDEFFYEVNEKNIENVAFDLRNNIGGYEPIKYYILGHLGVKEFYRGYRYKKNAGFEDSYTDIEPMNVINKYYYKVDNHYTGNFYVFTSNSTMSQASVFVNIVQNEKRGKIIGEIPGGAKNFYASAMHFKMPIDSIYLSIATEYWSSWEKYDSDGYIYPDIEVHEKDVLDTFFEYIDKD